LKHCGVPGRAFINDLIAVDHILDPEYRIHIFGHGAIKMKAEEEFEALGIYRTDYPSRQEGDVALWLPANLPTT
jgi:hypothetical protein